MEQTPRHNVTLALGSNHGQETNLSAACARLEGVVDIEAKSRRMWTEPIGQSPDRYLNMMLKGTTTLSKDQLRAALKMIERDCGRTDGGGNGGVVEVDIDIMEYDGQRMHRDDWSREYIKELSKEI